MCRIAGPILLETSHEARLQHAVSAHGHQRKQSAWWDGSGASRFSKRCGLVGEWRGNQWLLNPGLNGLRQLRILPHRNRHTSLCSRYKTPQPLPFHFSSHLPAQIYRFDLLLQPKHIHHVFISRPAQSHWHCRSPYH